MSAATQSPLRVLLVEDSPADAELIQRALRPIGALEVRRVDGEVQFLELLQGFRPQLILSDFSMPGFSGLRALELARERLPGVPLLFVSGTIGEELAIETLRRGAADYVLKDNLARLPSAARRVLDNAAEQARRLEAERALRASEERFRTVADTTEEWIWEMDRHGRLVYSNAGVERVLGRKVEDVIGQYAVAWMHEEDRASVEQRLPEMFGEGRGWRGWTLRWHHADGGIRWLESNAAPCFDEHGGVCGFRGADRDISQQVEREARLQFLAYHNAITGLPNRTAFRELLAARLEQGPQLVATLQPANFHDYVSSRGREFAEQLLSAMGERLAGLLPRDAVLAHLGEQSFAIALPLQDAQPEPQALRQLHDIERALREQPTRVDGESVHAGVCLGVALSPQHGEDALSLERNAETALSEATRKRESLAVYDQRYRQRVEQWIALERDLRGALEREEFELHFQPKYRVQGQQVSGAEALLRWRHPQRGIVSPLDFIPVVEQTGMIVELGEWVRRTAMAHAVRWRERGMGGLRIAVNVSARELHQPDFVQRTVAMLKPQADDQLLDLELTESLIMDDIQHSIGVLDALRDCGARISIDDFGTGYSSLNYLARLPVDALKIDRSFISVLAQSADALALVSNVIQLAHALGLAVVAEGVEDEEQAKLLRLLRCDEMQGYLLGRPMPAQQFEALLFD